MVRDGGGVNGFDCFSVCVRIYGAVCFGEATNVGSDGRLEKSGSGGLGPGCAVTNGFDWWFGRRALA